MPDRPRVVLDTNVILSAILFGGAPLQVLDAWRTRRLFDLVMSPEILAEILDRLSGKFKLPPSLVGEWQDLLPTNVIRVVPVRRIEVCRDPDDDKFLDAAAAAGARFLVTGDKDLLDMQMFETSHIVTPRALLAHLGL